MTILTRITAGLLATTCLAGAAAAQTELSLWYHGAGNEVERNILAGIVDDFNASQTDWKVSIEQFPQAAYNDSVTAAALSGELPDILDVDGPIMPNWAWAGYLAPLTIDPAKLDGFLPGRDRQVGRQGLFGRLLGRGARGLRAEVGARGERHPHPDAGQALDRRGVQRDPRQAQGDRQVRVSAQHRHGRQGRVVSLRLPALPAGASAATSSTARRYQTAEGVLNGDDAVEVGRVVPGPRQGRHGARHLAEPRRPPERLRRRQVRAELDRQLAGALHASRSSATTCCSCRRPTSATGRRSARPRGSSRCRPRAQHQDGANAFIEFALQDKYFTAFSDGIGLIPPTRSAAEASKYYAPGKPMEVFYDLCEKQGMLRPVTPGYVVQSKVFQKVAADIADGADVATVLDTAVDEIDADIKNNQGYGHSEHGWARGQTVTDLQG